MVSIKEGYDMNDRTKHNIAIFSTWIAIAILFNCVLFLASKAHYTPCDYQEPDCHYIQVVNPVTGILEQQYVCT